MTLVLGCFVYVISIAPAIAVRITSPNGRGLHSSTSQV